MIKLLIAGAGHIGSTIAHLLHETQSYHVILADQNTDEAQRKLHGCPGIHFMTLDVSQQDHLEEIIKKEHIKGLVACLPYFLNHHIAKAAKNTGANYFDLTEDVALTEYVHEIAKNSQQAFVPQCGLAPGLVNIIANDLIKAFEQVDTVQIRCGGLPKTSSHELHYALTWSVDGLINEYRRPCPALINGELHSLAALSNLEHVQIDGLAYEAFNTSGGIGSLAKTYLGKINTLNYKTLRYPGHRDRMRFLMKELKLGDDPELLKKILLNALPHTEDDVVLIYISVFGYLHNRLHQKDFVTKYYPKTINSIPYTALQMTTASSASAVIHEVMQSDHYQGGYHGLVKQEDFSLSTIFSSPFGEYLRATL